MITVYLYWKKAVWMSTTEIVKELKRYYSTCLSFNANLIVIDEDDSLSEISTYKFTFDIIKNIQQLDTNKTYILLERKEVNENSISLKELVHPKEGNYVIWTDYGTIPFNDFKNKINVHIETKDERPLWAITALGITLYDRFIK